MVYVNEFGLGLEKEMPSRPENPENELRVKENAPCSQVKARVKLEREGDPPGQAAALAGAAPTIAKVPAATKRDVACLRRLFMIGKS